MTEKKSQAVKKILQKAKVLTSKKGELSLLLEFAEVQSVDGKVYVTPHVIPDSPFIPHNDLVLSLKSLVPHWAIDAEEIESKKFNKAYFKENKSLDDPQLERFKVTGIKIFEKNEQEHVILFGRKILKTGKVINHSPVFNLDAEDEAGYVFKDELKTSLNWVRDEIDLYMGGKYAPDNQLKLFPNGQEPDGETSDEKAGKKRKAG